MTEAWIIDACRTPRGIGKIGKGALADMHPQRLGSTVLRALAASVPFPKRLGKAEEFAQLALAMVTNGYFNGEDVRLDGAIRMAPR